MTVPKYNEFYPYIIKCLDDGEQHTMSEIRVYCAKEAGLSKEQLSEEFSSGNNIFNNRTGWARTYLKKAGLISNPGRSRYVITDRGRKAIADGLNALDNAYLAQYAEFNEFTRRASATVTSTEDTLSPEDIIDKAIGQLNADLSDEVMEKVMELTPAQFEVLIVKLLVKMGYGNGDDDSGIVTGSTGDGGIDGIVKADKFGFDSVYIQAKHWQSTATIGRSELQKFVGALTYKHANKGLFITTAKFSQEAEDFAAQNNAVTIKLVNGNMLARLMIEYDMGVSTAAVYSIKKLDTDFFEDDL